MYSIGEQLYPDNILSEQRMFGDTSMLYGYPQKNEIFYSIKDGNWGDITTWGTVSGRVGLLPSTNDTVYVRHNVIYNIGNTSVIINNLFVSGILSHNGVSNTSLTIRNTFKVHPNGLIDVSNSITNIYFNLILLSNDNYCEKQCYINSPFTTITYGGEMAQKILDLNYANLVVGVFNLTVGIKYIENDLVVGNNLAVYGVIASALPTLDLRGYKLTVNGATTQPGTIYQGGQGDMLFIGNVNGVKFQLPGNPNVEFRGGLTFGNVISTFYNSGTGQFRFTTNNQTINTSNVAPILDAEIIVDNGLTVELIGSSPLGVTNIINGNNSSSQFINKTRLYFYTSIASNAMTTGIFDCYTFTNTIGYVYNGNDTIKQTTLSSLYVTGTGTKTLIGNTTLSGNLTMPTPALGNILELSSYDLLVTGDVAIHGIYSSIIRSTVSSGKLLKFRNYLGSTSGGILNVGTTNDIEMTGNNMLSQQAVFTCRDFIFSNTSVSTSGSQSLTINGNVIIYNNCTFTNTISFILTSLIGGNSSSTFINTSTGTVTLKSNSTLMSVGVFTQNGSITYDFTGNYTIPFSSFVNLTLTDLTGIKTLSADTVCSGFVRVGTSGINNYSTLELDNFDLTAAYVSMSGASTSIVRTPTSTGKLLKFGYFTGGVSSGIINMGTTNDIELTGGTMYTIGNTFTCRTLIISGNITTLGSTQSLTINGDMFIKSNIVYTYATTTQYFTINGVLNGENGVSALVMGTNSLLQYNNSTEPMVTGILNTSTNLNTFRYGNGNQDVKGGTYRNLILNGGGVKTLQGNVSVQNTYTLTAPATKNDNGYTFGNP